MQHHISNCRAERTCNKNSISIHLLAHTVIFTGNVTKILTSESLILEFKILKYVSNTLQIFFNWQKT